MPMQKNRGVGVLLFTFFWFAWSWSCPAEAVMDPTLANPLTEIKKDRQSEDPGPTEEKEIKQGAAEKEKSNEDECPSTFGPIITDTAVPIDKGKFALQPTKELGLVNDTLNQSWKRRRTGGDFKSLVMEVKFTYGLWDNLEAFMVVPLVHSWVTNFWPKAGKPILAG